MKRQVGIIVIILISIFISTSSIYAITQDELIALCKPEDEPIICQYLEEGIDYDLVAYNEMDPEDYIVEAVVNDSEYIIIIVDDEIIILQA